MSASEEPRIGAKLRSARQERALTLKEVSHRAGVSEGFLSLVERDKKTPSFGTLLSILRVLDVPLSTLLDERSHSEAYVVRSRAGRVSGGEHTVSPDTMLTPGHAKHVQVLRSVIAPRESSGRRPYAHRAEEEVVIVLSGALEVVVDGEVFELGAGDSLLLDPRKPHAYVNRTNAPAETMWILAGGSF